MKRARQAHRRPKAARYEPPPKSAMGFEGAVIEVVFVPDVPASFAKKRRPRVKVVDPWQLSAPEEDPL